jgi:hypothetical protein
LAIDYFWRPELASRLVLLAVAIATVAFVAWNRLVQPLSCHLGDLELAELLDRRRPGVGQRLTNVLQLPELLVRGRIDGSPAMIEAAVVDDAAELEKIDLEATLNISRRRKLVIAVVATLAVAAIFSMLFPSAVAIWSRRWLASSRVRWPQHTYLSVLGLNEEGRLLVPRGEAVTLEIDAAPELAADSGDWHIPGRSTTFASFGHSKPASDIPETVMIEYRANSGTRKQATLTHYEAGRFRYELPPFNEPGTFSLTGGDDWTESIPIEPIDRPGIRDLTITAHIPGRAQPEVHHAGRDEGSLQFLATTRLDLLLESDQPLASAHLSAASGEAPALEQIDASHYRAEMEMKATTTLEFQLTGQRAALTSKPFFLTFNLLVDRPPRLAIRVTGVGRRVTPQARIPLSIRAQDDFGVARISADLELTKIVDSKPQVSMHEPLSEKLTPEGEQLPTDREQNATIKLTEFSAAPGSTIRLRGRASDACVLGPQEGVSRWLPLSVVTPEELFYDILTRQREQRARFRKALDMAKGQLESLEKLSTTADAGGLPRVHQVVSRQVWQIAGQLDATLQEMIYNDLGSPQARDLLADSIIAPMRKLHDESCEKLQKLLAASELHDDARQEAVTAQQGIVNQMQRILAQMAQWESFVDCVNQLRQIIKSQDELLDATQKALSERIKGLFE